MTRMTQFLSFMSARGGLDNASTQTLRVSEEYAARLGESVGLPPWVVAILVRVAGMFVVFCLSYLAYLAAKRVLLSGVGALVRRSKAKWDDPLIQARFLRRLAHLAPAVVIHRLAPLVFHDMPQAAGFFQVAAAIYMVVAAVLVADALLNAAHILYQTLPVSREIPIKGFLQVVKILIIFFGVILILSFLMGEQPWYFVSGLGALTAVILFIFKDAILGLVAGVQLTANNMVRPGDWIEMPKYGANGNVIDVSLTAVKVQNFDKSVVTVPTYALVSDSFKNWRGMIESEGRRIKRAVRIDMNSIRFCTPTMLERFRKIQYISDYIDRKLVEIAAFNNEHNVDESVRVNGRRLTNIGTFRAYVESYLRHHPMIHQGMTFLVRHLDPTENGLPIEIIVFCREKEGARYEAVQSDIFDHILAVLPEFELRAFQRGSDYPAPQDLGPSI